ncbi:GNAT family N-acetyltransferase [Lacticaseibacillus casei]|jgi:ribosomal protein S18 acetylase RimI-like enzyme|uniref:GNAT family N-acetyltransferase n=1 Tax=Lacticaseibacillus huelsenbergensis TaxID=3035291 RepID=A0ABY8DNU9_9LACO|nr:MULTISPECIES: GNAT family N-acetyltransferase [Lacticaseibacillus]MDG3061850.1 GNAT family N-acetyltransferase [Lacticaseibacillus sp. BCRC 81376]QXG59868.1 GNAT family N-acetyltransferase [Lacticaseibacillus casei]WFB38659.1 GNAT family N-acetyltransferase [Lacticaseibacillus huelsenbergensis]
MLKFEEVAPEARIQYLDLLLVGDEDPAMLSRYLSTGTLFAALDDQVPVGVAMVVPVDEQTVELKNLAVASARRRQGIASGLLRHVGLVYATQQYQEILVGTGDVDFDNLRFYMRRGFRLDSIRKHFFDQYSQPVYADGLKLQDMLVLRRKLLLTRENETKE